MVTIIKTNCEEKISKLNEELLKEENNMFFVCPEGHLRCTFDEASDEDFFCVCGEELVFQDNSEIIKNIKKEIKQTETELESFLKKVNK